MTVRRHKAVAISAGAAGLVGGVVLVAAPELPIWTLIFGYSLGLVAFSGPAFLVLLVALLRFERLRQSAILQALADLTGGLALATGIALGLFSLFVPRFD